MPDYDPEGIAIAGGYQFLFPIEHVRVTVKRLADDRRTQSTSGEVEVESIDQAAPGHIHQSRINLTSTQGKNGLIKVLRTANEAIDWDSIVETFCKATLEMHREGEPFQFIGNRPLSGGVKYRLWPICPEGMPAIVFGEGGTGKSFVALLAAILVQSGNSTIGLHPAQGNVLYLDYETSAETQNERVKAICAGLEIPEQMIGYRYCYHPLAEDVETLQEMCGSKGIQFLIVDSLGAACGGDPSDPDLAIRMFNAMRQLHVSSLLIDHVAKNTMQGQSVSPYGSVYKTNLARSVWHIKPTERTEANHTHVALYHKKVNFGPLRDALGFDLMFQNDDHEQLTAVRFNSFAVKNDPELMKNLPIRKQIMACLEGRRMNLADLCVELDTTPHLLSPRLSELKKSKVLGSWGELWGILDLQTQVS
jgi:hypothetical protein